MIYATDLSFGAKDLQFEAFSRKGSTNISAVLNVRTALKISRRVVTQTNLTRGAADMLGDFRD